MSFFNYFTDSERSAASRATILKNRVFGAFGPTLARLHISPDALSYMGLSLLVGVVIWFVSHPYRAVFLIVGYVVIDGLDGAYARYLDRPTQSGAFTDIIADQLGMVVITLGFMQYRMVDGLVGSYYIIIYLTMITFSVIQNAQGIPMQYIFRSKYILYGIYAFWAFFRVNLAPALLPLFCLAMTVSVIQSYLRLKRGIYYKYDLPKVLAHEQDIRAEGGTPPRFWPSLNVILPGLVITLLLFMGAYTQIRGMVEMADVRPDWRQSKALPLIEAAEEPRSIAPYHDGWLVSTYNPKTRFSRVYYLDEVSLSLRGTFRIPWALHHHHGACSSEDHLYIADRLSRAVFAIDVAKSLESGISVLDDSFDTTLDAPVACALVEIGGKRRMLISEYMHKYKTLVVDYEKAFTEGTAKKAILGWYRNAGFSRGLAAEGGRIFEVNSSIWRDLIYVVDIQSALNQKYIRSGLVLKIAAPDWHCRDIAIKGSTLALVDHENNRLFLADFSSP